MTQSYDQTREISFILLFRSGLFGALVACQPPDLEALITRNMDQSSKNFPPLRGGSGRDPIVSGFLVSSPHVPFSM